MTFRPSAYIDFDTGVVRKPPMELQWERRPPWSLPDKVDLFECSVDVWQLGPAVAVLKQIEEHQPPSIWSHAAYALLAIGFTYFEMLGKTLNPNSSKTGTAGVDFNYGFCDAYPAFALGGAARTNAALPDVQGFCDRVRNGMYHLGSTKEDLVIHNNPSISKDDFFIDKNRTPRRYYVNPHQMIRTIVALFPTFTTRLRDPGPNSDDLRTQFIRFFDEFHK